VASGRDERVFLVRMWLERSTAQREAWRGSIQDVGSGRKFYVTGPGEIADFIAVRLDEDGPSNDAS
jgi:hypothetical protein